MSGWAGYRNYDHHFNYSDVDLTGFNLFLTEIAVSMSTVAQATMSKGNVDYFNIPASFDIETYSSYQKGKKFANMYIWQVGINGSTIIGRTWAQFVHFLEKIQSHFVLHEHRRLIFYVHNLGYEFQFMRKWIPWVKDKEGKSVVFSLKERRPIYALSQYGIEFRCSYILSNYNLAHIGAEVLHEYLCEKMVGDLDYTIPRNSKTVLTTTELKYCLNDVRVVMSYIQEQIEQNGGITKLPLTNTGRVRLFCNDYCNGSYCEDPVERKKISIKYFTKMTALQITSKQEYELLKAAFAGGFTHANSLYIGELLENVGSADLTSSYPYAMVSDYFPMSTGKFVGTPSREAFINYLETKCCLFIVELFDVHQDFDFESYISASKCIELSDDAVVNNGRVTDASHLTIAITEIDFSIITRVYKFSPNFNVYSMYIYEKGYLPRDFILSILHLYSQKTSLKGVKGMEVMYMVFKNMINSCYGMAVTDIVREEAIYSDGRWNPIEMTASRETPVAQLTHYNRQYNRFLFYPWGIWVTAHARYNLWQAIFEFGEDYVYADTDSIKGLNFNRHLEFFEKYNKDVKFKLSQMCLHYSIPWRKVAPKTNYGVEKVIGLWDMEEGYKHFKTLGAKRYCYEYLSGEFNMTVAGVNKTACVPYLLSHYCGFDYETAKLAYSPDPNLKEESKKAMKLLLEQHKTLSYKPAFDAFEVSLEIPAEHTGKMTHSYLDSGMAAQITDTQGNTEWCYERSYTHLEPASYYFSIAEQFFEFLLFGRTTYAE